LLEGLRPDPSEEKSERKKSRASREAAAPQPAESDPA
jgi:hypothetical protein